MKLAGHSKFETTYNFYLRVKDGLLDRARKAITHIVSPELLQKCCSSDFESSTQKAAERKCLTALKLANEADATRTRNLRIDSPKLRFVSTYVQRIKDGKIKTYDGGSSVTAP